ncbi:MAG: hypothetical protein WAM14_02160 [Candidatus Nitrosopolaris sp.]
MKYDHRYLDSHYKLKQKTRRFWFGARANQPIKVAFTDATGKPYARVSTAKITFANNIAEISNEVANLQRIGPGVFSVTEAYISQPGEWDKALAAQVSVMIGKLKIARSNHTNRRLSYAT